MTLRVFAGPSAHGLASGLRPTADCWLPPARRGDVDALVDGFEPGVIVLCDGVFDAVPAVSHAELCRAIDSGWKVWGVASLGAIRAWELRGEGMNGYGQVYSMFERFSDFTDDEMCLMYFPEEPYFPVTEALVNVRVALQEHATPCGISPETGARLIDRLRGLWYGTRTESLIRKILVEDEGINVGDVDTWLTFLRTSRIKNRDLASLLRERPWHVEVRE